MPSFIPGLRLSEFFYHEAVQPILERAFPRLIYSAGLLGPGSEVLDFDTIESTDHNWGPRLLLFVSQADFAAHRLAIVETLCQTLPREIHGYATNFGTSDEPGTLNLRPMTSGPINHKVDVTTVGRFLHQRLGIDSYPDLALADWLTCPEQCLLEVTAGKVFHDGLGDLEKARATLQYYPRDVWLHLLTAQWTRIAQAEAFVGRAGHVGDELGSALIAATLTRDLMRLAFLMERTYAPYSKWLGTAFGRLRCAPLLRPLLEQTVAARSWKERETVLGQAFSAVAAMHNALNITDPLPTEVSRFHDRPYFVLDAERFSHAIRERIVDDRVRRLPPAIGSIDQYVDSTDALANHDLRQRLRAIYEGDQGDRRG